MNWKNVKLILAREVRDQLRDRRTLFMIAVLPMLLYPLLGVSFIQVSQFMRAHPTRIWVIGGDTLAAPPLLEKASDSSAKTEFQQFDQKLFAEDNAASLLEVDTQAVPAGKTADEAAREAVRDGKYDAVVVFPSDFSARLQEFRDKLLKHDGEREKTTADAKLITVEVPKPRIDYDTSKEKSLIAFARVSDVLRQWSEAIGQQNLKDSEVPVTTAKPVEFERNDVAEAGHRDAATWSKVLPFVLLIWALTGAFYPAIDLCAGEKERGTLETLLSSPAERSEIVTGKLLTIMAFSMATSILNLLSMGFTGLFVVHQMAAIGTGAHLGLPPLETPIWLLLALVPVSALFSALCLALAALARSSKEGQYYLMPLLLVTMPLMILPMAPAVELNLGNSLIPVTGVILLLRMLLEGNYAQALPFVLPVVAMTLLCCLLATRWAVDQFNKESVLFREGDRLDLGLWLKHLVRDRGDTPSVSEAIFCGVLILAIRFFMTLAATKTDGFTDFAVQTLVLQLTALATPMLLMTVMLTRRPLQTLLLRKPTTWLTAPAAIVLAVAIHPLAVGLSELVLRLYPVDPEMFKQELGLDTMLKAAPLGWALLVIAVLPALLEELTFRGFILSGLRHMGHKWRAIAISSVLFGIAHLVFQQTLITASLGFVLGYVAVQTGSLWPGVIFHACYNSLTLLSSRLGPDALGGRSGWEWALRWNAQDERWQYQPALLVLCAIVAAVVLAWFARLTHSKSQEETLQEAIDHQMANPLIPEANPVR